jgi:hypothetical protein
MMVRSSGLVVLAPEIYLNKFDIIDFLVISFDFVLKIHAIKRRI